MTARKPVREKDNNWRPLTWVMPSLLLPKETLQEYVDVCLAGDTKAEARLRDPIRTMFQNSFTPKLEPWVFDTLIVPLLTNDVSLPHDPANMHWVGAAPITCLYTVVLALQNENCPPYVLSLAAHHKEEDYRMAAWENPNLPEEDKVFLWLKEGWEPDEDEDD